MKIRSLPALLIIAAVLIAAPAVSFAQVTPVTPAPPPPGWAGSASAGIALTSGNSDTSTVNAAYEVKRDTGGLYVIKSTGLLVWGKSEGELNNDRLALAGRVERKISPKTAIFGQTQYLRDSFKAIDYLVSPTVGVSHQLWKDDRTELGVDGAVGVVWEQNPGFDLQTDGALTAGQQLSHKLTSTTELKQTAAALWKMDDLGDALYTFSAGAAASITAATQMKVQFLDTFKTQPPTADIKKNDIALLVSFVYKFE